jgi:hypothetical protein
MSPFRVVYGRDPLSMRAYAPTEAHLCTVHSQLMERDEFLLEIHEWLMQAQQQYKLYYDWCHRELEFEPGQWVWLRLLHHPMASLDVQGLGKLGPKFYGPFEIEERVSEVAYK